MKLKLNFGARCILLGLVVFSLSSCVERPENEMVQEVERENPASGIDLTTQADGIFKGFANEEKKAVIIEVEGEEKTYPLPEGGVGELVAGDAITFSTTTKDGQELIETLRKK